MGGSARALFRDGRQPRQQRGQPILGLPAGTEFARQGVPDLDEHRWGDRFFPDRAEHRVDSTREPPEGHPAASFRSVIQGSRGMKRTQGGMTLIGFVIVLAVVGVFIYMGMNVIPMYSVY